MAPAKLPPSSFLDFLYLDQKRIDSLATQLFHEGALKETRSKLEQARSDEDQFKFGVSALGGQYKSDEKSTESHERFFNVQWRLAPDVLAELQNSGIAEGVSFDVPIGAYVRCRGTVSVLDMRMLQAMWSPLLDMLYPPLPNDAPKAQKRDREGERLRSVRWWACCWPKAG